MAFGESAFSQWTDAALDERPCSFRPREPHQGDDRGSDKSYPADRLGSRWASSGRYDRCLGRNGRTREGVGRSTSIVPGLPLSAPLVEAKGWFQSRVVVIEMSCLTVTKTYGLSIPDFSRQYSSAINYGYKLLSKGIQSTRSKDKSRPIPRFGRRFLH